MVLEKEEELTKVGVDVPNLQVQEKVEGGKMGFIKKTIKEAWRKKSKARKEKRAYREILSKKTTAIKRQAYSKEAIIQARANAKADAKVDYQKQKVSKGTLPKIKSKGGLKFLGGMVDNFYANTNQPKRRKK